MIDLAGLREPGAALADRLEALDERLPFAMRAVHAPRAEEVAGARLRVDREREAHRPAGARGHAHLDFVHPGSDRRAAVRAHALLVDAHDGGGLDAVRRLAARGLEERIGR